MLKPTAVTVAAQSDPLLFPGVRNRRAQSRMAETKSEICDQAKIEQLSLDFDAARHQHAQQALQSF